LIYGVWKSGQRDASPEGLKAARAFENDDGDAHRQAGEALAGLSDGTIAIVDMPDEGPTHFSAAGPPASGYEARHFRRDPMPVWKIASFSSLVSKRPDHGEILDRDMDREEVHADIPQTTVRQGSSRTIGEMARFEAGPRAGVFLHDILENIDFTASDTKTWEEVIEDRMLVHGINRRWKHVICEMLGRVVNTPLNTEKGRPFGLKQVAIQDRINEMEFHLPLRALDAVTLERVFAGNGSTSFQGKLDGLVEQLAFSLSGGYLKGFIDLVFRHDGRYFIIDWKSNHLGDSFDSYHPDRLADIMVSDFYFLQYHIYVMALDRYLRTTCRGYAYEKDFGGVFYCFIRGMGPSPGGPSGIFFDCPDPDLMQRLDKIMLL
jgi:exodeoxyribonuclease V beta subunit